LDQKTAYFAMSIMQVALMCAGCAYVRRLRLCAQVALIKKPALSGFDMSAAGHKKTRV
jgi:hypothetical protein